MTTEKGGISKIEEVYLYIIKNSLMNVNFGHILFNKILYFSDFDMYERKGKSITQDYYIRSAHGPTAASFVNVISGLKEKKLVRELRAERSKGHIQIRYVLMCDFEPNQLNKDEIKELDRNMARLGGMTAMQVSEYSHQDMPYKATKDGEKIDYGLVHYRNPVYSALEKDEPPEQL